MEEEQQQQPFPTIHDSWYPFVIDKTANPPMMKCMLCEHEGMAQITTKHKADKATGDVLCAPTQCVKGCNIGRPFFSCWEKEGGCGEFIGFLNQKAPTQEKRKQAQNNQKKRANAATPVPTEPIQLPPHKRANVNIDTQVVQVKLVLQILGDLRKNVNDPNKLIEMLDDSMNTCIEML
jgi:hypothetical protein